MLSRAYGWREDKTQQKPLMLSPYRFASCSKLITSMCVHQLIARGDLALNTVASTEITLPDLSKRPIVMKRWSTATVQDLLRMDGRMVRRFEDRRRRCLQGVRPRPAGAVAPGGRALHARSRPFWLAS